jgi:hypothetical protein
MAESHVPNFALSNAGIDKIVAYIDNLTPGKR